MIIYNASNVKILEVVVDDNSYRHRVVMGEHSLTLYFSLFTHVEIPVGAWCEFEGTRYYLERPEALKMKHTRYFSYTVVMESDQAKTKRWKFRNPIDGRIKFPLTATPKEHLQMLIDNMNRRDSGWTIGSCVEGEEHLISYDNLYCWDALGLMANEFKTEFEIAGKSISLKKMEYNKSNPLALSYGKGNGFRSGVGRSNASDKMPVEILFVQGGTQNIDPSKAQQEKIRNKELLLPIGQTLGYDGEHFSDEGGYNSSNGRVYVVDDKGLSIRRNDKTFSSYAEDCLDGSDYYPKRDGAVSEVITVDAANHFYDIVDSSIPDALDYSENLIAGEKMTIIFQSGMLAGKEFEVNYYRTAKNGKKAKRFEIVPQEIDGETMPNATFTPKGGDKYAVFHCALPDAYICDNESKSGAAWDMLRAAIKYMFDNEEQLFSFTGELDGIWAKKDWTNIGGKIVLGGYVSFTDAQFQTTPVLVRITGIKDYINKPHSPVIELSNKTQSAGFSSELAKLESNDVTMEKLYSDGVSFTKRRWRDAQESLSMLNDLLEAGFDNFTNNINPITIQTMAMLVGDESLQYRFVNSTTKPSTANHLFNYNNSTRIFSTSAGIIQHMTLGISNLSSSHKSEEYKYWIVFAFNSAALTDGSKRYYLYIKASTKKYQTNTDNVFTAEFMLSETAINMNRDAGIYYFLCGLLNSEYEGERSFVTLYGFTEVLPGRITTDRIVSGEGNSYFDMVANAMKLGDALDFNSKGDGKLRIKGTIVQSQGGTDESPIGCYRGQYNDSIVYYYGDEVWYLSNNTISTYRYINETASSGHKPTDTNYWQVLAAGVRGFFKARAFKRTNEDISKVRPTGGSYESPVPTSDGWTDGIPDGTAILWSTVCTFYSDGTASSWSLPVKETDTDLLDIEFSPSTAKPSVPQGDTPFANHESEGWYDPNSANFDKAGTMIWRAERKVSNGVYDGAWVITRIYGETGDAGRAISQVNEYYALTNLESGVTYNNVTWKKNALPTGSDVKGPYLWNYEEIIYSKGDPTKTPPVLIGHNAKDGVSIVSVTEYYLATSQYTGITRETSGWQTDPTKAKVTAEKKYLWNYEKIELSEGDPIYSDPAIIGAYGDTGIGLFKSTAFIRLPNDVTDVDVPTGGDWSSPIPTSTVKVTKNLHTTIYVWSDAIPDGDYALWATTRVFYTDGTASEWSNPKKMTDTSTYDVEFAKKQTDDAEPAIPTTANRHGGSGTQVWFDPELDSSEDFTQMYWRAERELKNGQEWGVWTITRIKGEKGDDAEFYGLKITTRTVKLTELESGGRQMAPGTITWQAIHVKGDTETELSSLPTGWYMRLYRSGIDNSATSNPITTASYRIVAGTLFGWVNYDYAQMTLYDNNNKVIATADVSLIQDGANGNDGINGDYYEYRYAVNGSTTVAPALYKQNRDPSTSEVQWNIEMPTVDELRYLWLTIAKINGEDDNLVEDWSNPIRINPVEVGRKIIVRGTRHNGETVPTPYCYVDDKDITINRQRGLNLLVLKAEDMSVVFPATGESGNFDTYLDTSTSQTYTTNLVNRLKYYENEAYIIILYSYDAMSLYSKLFVYLQKFGCGWDSEIKQQRHAFAFIGRYGLQKGQGFVKASNVAEFVDIKASVIKGELVANGADGSIGINLVDNSEIPESFSILESGSSGASDGQFLVTQKYFPEIPIGQTVSGQCRITLAGCSPKEGGGNILVYFGSNKQWPTVAEIKVTADGVYDIKNECQQVNSPMTDEVWTTKYIHMRLNNFNAGGTITIERVKVEVGICTPWSPSLNDNRGPALVFRGDYSATDTYYGTISRVDAVYYSPTGLYYVARSDKGSFNNKLPTNADYWNEFGGQFDSVATKLLLAQYANIAGWIFRRNRLESQIMSDGTTSTGETAKTPMVYLDGVNGLASFAGGKVLFRSNGSVQIGSGTKLFTIDTSGNVKMANIDAEGGTFKGVINANGGLILQTQKITSAGTTINAATVYCKVYIQTGNDPTIYFPTNPNTGQYLIVKNTGVQILINAGSYYVKAGGSELDNRAYQNEGDYYAKNVYVAERRVKIFVFDGTYWNSVARHDY